MPFNHYPILAPLAGPDQFFSFFPSSLAFFSFFSSFDSKIFVSGMTPTKTKPRIFANFPKNSLIFIELSLYRPNFGSGVSVVYFGIGPIFFLSFVQ